jgi:dihydroflavonol-4-reductase
VHVSSYAALLPSSVPLTPVSPTGNPEGAYLVSKADSERVAFWLRQQGAPVVVTNPSGVDGPYDPHRAESTQILRDRLVGRSPMHLAGSIPIIEVRDLALDHARRVAHGPDQSRFLAAGRRLTLAAEGAILRRVTGRRLPAVPVPSSCWRYGPKGVALVHTTGGRFREAFTAPARTHQGRADPAQPRASVCRQPCGTTAR